MTATLATPVDARAAKFAEMRRREAAFAAVQAPCPDSWCNGECKDNLDFGDSIMHTSDAVTVPTATDSLHEPVGSITMHAWLYESLGEPTESGIELNLTNAGWLFDECANFTAAQARQLAAELLRHADRVEPECEVPATEIRVRDWLPVGDAWFRVYGITVDEPTDTVQIYTTVDWDTLPEFGGDEEPHVFDINDLVRVRRDGAR